MNDLKLDAIIQALMFIVSGEIDKADSTRKKSVYWMLDRALNNTTIKKANRD